MREGKRWKRHDEESDEEMEGVRGEDALEEERGEYVLEEEKGTKREFTLEEETGSKRGRVEGGRKRREREESSEEESGKRVRSEMGSKRSIEEVDESSEEEEGPRNADSDVDEEEGEERPRRSKGGKRARSMEGRRGSEDDELMEGTMDDLSVPPEPASEAASSRKRTLGSAKKVVSSSTARVRKGSIKGKGAPKAGRRPGEEWTNIEGDRYRVGEDGLQRRLCEVREWRKKYKMVRAILLLEVGRRLTWSFAAEGFSPS